MQYKGVICFSAIDWNFLKQRTHYLMSGLAAEGLKVLFIENTGVRSPRMGDLSRIVNRLRNATARMQAVEPPAGIEIFSPIALPLPYNRLATLYNKLYIFSRIKVFLETNKLVPSEVIFWTYLATPVVFELMRCLHWGTTVYDLVSDPKFIEPRLEPYEKEITGLTDFTLFASSTLCEQYFTQTKNPVLFRDGFNLELLNESNNPAPEMESLPHPRFLFIGGINKKVQLDALAVLAEHYRDGSVVLIGPLSEGLKIPPFKNIHIFPPRKRYGELAGFLRAADLGLIPYAADKYSGSMQPAKLNEYMIFGLPVVANATPELKKLAGLWGKGAFYFYESPEKIVAAAEKALAEENPGLKKERHDLAAKNTWGKRIKELSNMLNH